VRAYFVALIFVAGFVSGQITVAQKQDAPRMPAERVTGIGGVFFKARDPKALATWYRDTLGVPLMDGATFAPFLWRERENSSQLGTTVWSVFNANSNYFAPSSAALMINYRVRNLDRMLAQLRAAGVNVDGKIVEDFNGRFAWIVDPEGNKIELWEPKTGY
jgi:predicted enzyme related to lactoylglutathione lyase